MIRLRPPSEPFHDFLKQARSLLGFWAKFTAATVVVTLLFGAFVPLAVVAFLFTLCLPILMLVLWGRALDQELGWTELDDGPW